MDELEQAIEKFLRANMEGKEEGVDFDVMGLSHFMANLTEGIAETILNETK